MNPLIEKQIKPLQDWLAKRKDPGVSDKKGYSLVLNGTTPLFNQQTAARLSKETGMQVFRVDLDKIVSKYIGETSKNLDRLFSEAEANNQILFFDEADALFGKRTGVKDAHDRYANIEVAYLLQKIEDAKIPIIIATRKKTGPLDPGQE